ncbi:MAG: flagellar hook-basal body complex protein FliE [Defluviitaleaceae bacterium]|nr:flagellar hook-basal body complex protein FliE [Defluviitaleaceae bacterium]
MVVGSVNPVNTLAAINHLQNIDATQATQETRGSGNVFSMMLDAMTNMVNTAAEFDAINQNTMLDFAIGRHDDMLAVILAQEQAFASMSFTVQVTSRIVGAYQEIMRMQI